MILVVMGVSGCGKSTIGALLAERLGCKFSDADDFHPPANIEKMRQGIPLDDDDRAPWLAAIRSAIEECHREGRNHVFACSALRQRYREVLSDGGRDHDVVFVFLKGDYAVIEQRLSGRRGHFFDPRLLRSQFDALEVPQDALVADITLSPDDLVADVIARLPARQVPATGPVPSAIGPIPG